MCKTTITRNLPAMLILLQSSTLISGYVSKNNRRELKSADPDMKMIQRDEASLYKYTFMAIFVKHTQVTRKQGTFRAESRESVAEGKGKLVCGGAIIHPDWVLTSAACFDENIKPQFYEVYAGIIDLRSEVGQQIRHIEKIFIHPQYKPSSDEFNIAMVKVTLSFKITTYVSAGNLPVGPLSITGTERCHILGFVREYETVEDRQREKYNDRLIKVQLHAVEYRECLMRLKRFHSQKPYTMTKTNYCLIQIEDYPHNNSQGACEGDIGGPCICGFKIQGVIAHFTNDTCYTAGYPTTIVDVGYHLNWMRANILQLNVIPKSLGTTNKNSFSIFLFHIFILYVNNL